MTGHAVAEAMAALDEVNGPEDQARDHDAVSWDAIDWRACEGQVRRLRQRIFKATREQDWPRVRNLQKLMLRSRANTLVSVRQVTQRNAGRRTAGIDGEVALTPEARAGAAVRVHQSRSSWNPRAVRRVHIPKASNRAKLRPLGIPVIMDRCHQARVRCALEPEWEARFEPRSYGFRPGRGCHDAIESIFNTLGGRHAKRRWILDADLAAALDPWSHCSFADFRAQNSWSWGLGSSIRRPFMRPVRVRTAGSSPRFTRCNMVWRETPRARVAWWMATQPSGVSSASMARNSSVSRMRQGAPGVTCSPATKPSLSQRSRVEGAICSSRAAWLTLSSSPSSWPAVGWWQGMCQWVRSEATLLAVNDIPRAVVRCCRLRIPAIVASG